MRLWNILILWFVLSVSGYKSKVYRTWFLVVTCGYCHAVQMFYIIRLQPETSLKLKSQADLKLDQQDL